ncbi:MAG: cytochrome P450 [Myxococcales bacterium]|nr:cytochrome P450 [Myxococcales bacterium]
MHEIPLLPGGNWLGHVMLFRRNRMGFLRALVGAGDICRMRFYRKDVVLVTAPELVQEVLVERARSFEKSAVLRYLLYPLAGEGLFTSRGELWRRQRRIMAPLFSPAQISRYARDMVACAERTIDTWGDGEVRDMARETTRITMSVAGKTLFDADTFSEADELGAALTTVLAWVGRQGGSLLPVMQAQLSRSLERLSERLSPGPRDQLRALAARLHGPVLLFGRGDRAMTRAVALLDRRVQRMIDDRRAAGLHQPDLLTRLLTARDEADGGAMSDRQVRDEVLTLFVAGHETTATGLAWALYLLARHPEQYRRAQAEADALAGPPSHEDLPRLDYTQRVFKEALRLYPPVPLFSREAISDVTVGGHRLPCGTFVFLSPFATQRRPDLWSDPERFDPDRFLPEQEERRHRYAYFPFSAGPRICLGIHFALMEGPLVLATLLQRATFTLTTDAPIEPEANATLRPGGGLPMRVRLRSPAWR